MALIEETFMEEKDVDHVRMIQRGHLSFPLLTFQNENGNNLQMLVHSSRYGFSFLSTSQGLQVLRFHTIESQYEECCEERNIHGSSDAMKIKHAHLLSNIHPFFMTLNMQHSLLAIVTQNEDDMKIMICDIHDLLLGNMKVIWTITIKANAVKNIEFNCRNELLVVSQDEIVVFNIKGERVKTFKVENSCGKYLRRIMRL